MHALPRPTATVEFQLGPWHIDVIRHLATRAERSVRLTATEVGLLTYLRERGEPVTREELLRDVMGYSEGTLSRAVDAAVKRLRAKLEPDTATPQWIRSRRSVGVWLEGLTAAHPRPEIEGYATPYHPRPDTEDAVRQLLGAWRVVTLAGPGGVGKSRLLDFLTRDSPEPFVWVSVAGAHSASDVLRRIAAAARIVSAEPDRVAKGLSAQRARCALDEVELALEPCREVVNQLTDVRFLTTSRQPLGVPGEAVVEVPCLHGEDARAFLRNRLAASRWSLPATDAQLDELATRLDGLPLALELAAAQSWPVERLLGKLDEGLLPGDSGERLRENLLRSVEQLSGAEHELLCALTLCEGPIWRTEVVEWMGPEAGSAFDALADRSLLTQQPEGWRVLRLVRLFMADRPADWEGLQLRFEAWLCSEAIRLGYAMVVDPRGTLVPWARRRDDLVAALSTVAAEELPNIVPPIIGLLDAIGPHSTCEDVLRIACRRRPDNAHLRALWLAMGAFDIEALNAAGADPDVRARVFALQARTAFAGDSVDYDGARRLLDEDLTELQRLRVRQCLAIVATSRGNAGPEAFRAVLDDASGFPVLRIKVHLNLAVYYQRAGDFDAALRELDRIAWVQESGLTRAAIRFSDIRASVLARTDLEAGIEAYLSLIDRCARAGEPDHYVHAEVGALTYALGDCPRAMPHLRIGGQSMSLRISHRLAQGLVFLCRLRQGDPEAPGALEAFMAKPFVGIGQQAFFTLELALHRALTSNAPCETFTTLAERARATLAAASKGERPMLYPLHRLLADLALRADGIAAAPSQSSPVS